MQIYNNNIIYIKHQIQPSNLPRFFPFCRAESTEVWKVGLGSRYFFTFHFFIASFFATYGLFMAIQPSESAQIRSPRRGDNLILAKSLRNAETMSQRLLVTSVPLVPQSRSFRHIATLKVRLPSLAEGLGRRSPSHIRHIKEPQLKHRLHELQQGKDFSFHLICRIIEGRPSLPRTVIGSMSTYPKVCLYTSIAPLSFQM